jgi:tetratricopeptide (TPR) repeat protein
MESFCETPLMADTKPTPIIRDAGALLVRGIDALERNHLDEAIALLRQAVGLEPALFHGHLALGIALTKALKIPQAQRALETAIELEPKNFYAHLRLAQMYQRVGVVKEAKQECRVALDLAHTAEEKKIARDMLEAGERRDAHRAWRPDFAGLIGKGRRKK